MATKICLKCGCSNFIADRALAGRIVCSRCGTPYERGNAFIAKRSNKKIRNLLVILAITIFTIVLIS